MNRSARQKEAGHQVCEYTVRPRGAAATTLCGLPAAVRGTTGTRLFYCTQHGEFVRRAGLPVAPLEGGAP